MSLFNKITEDVKTAMKSGDKGVLVTLRSLMSECKNEAIGTGATPTDDHCLTAIKRTIKRMENSIEMFVKGDRHDLADVEKDQHRTVSSYLPKQLTESELAQVVAQAVSEVGATTKKDMQKVMKWLNESAHKAAIDMKTAVAIIQKHLQ